jgi:hypothetical protein
VETQSTRKINWLVVANLVSYNNPTIIYKYILYVSPIILSLSFLLGLIALIAGLITVIFIKGRQSKKIGLAGIVLGILGIVGNLYTIFVLAMQ